MGLSDLEQLRQTGCYCGGHAKSVVDSIVSQGEYEIVGFVAEKYDDNFEYRGYKIIGTDQDLESLYDSGIKYAFVCIGYMGKGNVRQKLYDTLKQIGYSFIVLLYLLIDSMHIITLNIYDILLRILAVLDNRRH